MLNEQPELNYKLDYKYTVCAVVFGADKSILNLRLKDGFRFVLSSLNPKIDHHIDEKLQTEIFELRREYETAIVESNGLEVICIEKELKKFITTNTASEWYEEQVNKDLESLDKQIRLIRLLCECSLRYKVASFRMYSEEPNKACSITGYSRVCFNAKIPSPDSVAGGISSFNCTENEIKSLQWHFDRFRFPIQNTYLNGAYLHYDKSYFLDKYLAIIELISALESLYLSDRDGKKERLAKRLSVNLFDTRIDRVKCYNFVKNAYEKRSEVVHEGQLDGVDDDTILLLRQYLRTTILKAKQDSFTQKEFAAALKDKVKGLDYFSSNV